MAGTNKTLSEILESGSASFRRLNQGGASRSVPAHHAKPAQPPRPLVATISVPEPKPDLSPALDSGPQAEARRVQPTPKRPRIGVAFTLYRVRLLDPDNKWASCKLLLDAIRAAGLIPDDDEDTIDLSVSQYRVSNYIKEGTGVVLKYR